MWIEHKILLDGRPCVIAFMANARITDDRAVLYEVRDLLHRQGYADNCILEAAFPDHIRFVCWYLPPPMLAEVLLILEPYIRTPPRSVI